jgi:hypothetical protein
VKGLLDWTREITLEIEEKDGSSDMESVVGVWGFRGAAMEQAEGRPT